MVAPDTALARGCGAALRALRSAGLALAGAALAAIVAIYAYEVVSRYFFGAPTRWSAEFVSYLLCITVFAAMPHVTASGAQVAVTVLVETLGVGARRRVGRGIALVGIVVCAAMAVFAAEETVRQFVRDVRMVAAVPLPKWWISGWIALGFGVSALEFLRLLLRPPTDGLPATRPPEV